MAATRKLIVQVIGDAKGLTKTLKQAERDAMSFGDKVASATKRMAVPAAAAFGALSASAVMFARAAAEDQKAAALLANQLRQTTGATTAQVAATEDFISKLSMAIGVADDELRPALAQLVRATGNVGEAQSLLKTALDVSAGSGRSLSQVVQALSRASQGQFTALRRLGIPLDENIIKTKDFDAVLRVLAQTFGGQADVAANTSAGQMRRFSVAVGEAQEAIGATLLPVIEAILPKLVGLAEWAQKNAGLIAAVGSAVAGFAGTIVLAGAALKAWQAIAKVTTIVNMGLASSHLAIKAATVIGLGAAVAASYEIGRMTRRMQDAAMSANNLADSMGQAGDDVRYGFTPQIKDANDAATALFGTMGHLNNYTLSGGMFDKGGMMGHVSSIMGVRVATSNTVKETDRLTSSTGKAEDGFSKFQQRVKAAKDAVRQYVASIRDAIAGSVSLSDAFSQATEQQLKIEQDLKDATEERIRAYDALNQAKQTGDTLGFAKALEDVAAAQKKVDDALAAKPQDYTAIFRAQIESAKNFAANLKALIATGNLSRSALQQLLALGPVAGAQVAQDLLNGVGGFTAASLSADLASVEAAGRSVGMAIPGVSELLGSRSGQQGNKYYITVQAGVGDKTAIAREVVDLLKIYNRSNGAIPVRVTG